MKKLTIRDVYDEDAATQLLLHKFSDLVRAADLQIHLQIKEATTAYEEGRVCASEFNVNLVPYDMQVRELLVQNGNGCKGNGNGGIK